MVTQNKKTALICGVLVVSSVLVAAATQAQGVSFEGARNFAAGGTPRSVAVGDFNGDGRQDLAVANYNSSEVSVLLGNGDVSFQAARNFGVGDTPVSVAVGDFDGDGRPDLAVVNGGSDNVSVLINNTFP